MTNNLGVLFTGPLEKRGSYTKSSFQERYFVLTSASLHYFRRPKGHDFFGEERGVYPLKTIVTAEIRTEKLTEGSKDASGAVREIEIRFSTKEEKIVARAENAAKAEEWIKAIASSQKANKGVVRRKTITGNFMSVSIVDTLKIQAVIVYDKDSKEERLVTREMGAPVGMKKWGKDVNFGALPKNGEVVFIFDTGSTAVVSTKQLFDSASNKNAEYGDHTLSGINLEEGTLAVPISMSLRSYQSESGGSSQSNFKMVVGGIFLIISAIAAAEMNLDAPLKFAATTLGILIAVNMIMEAVQQKAKVSASFPPIAVSIASYDEDDDDEDDDDDDDEISSIPKRFMKGCNMDKVEALRRWDITEKWREDEKVDLLMQEKQPHFDVIKKHYPHFFHKRDKLGHPIYIEIPAKTNLKAMTDAGVTMDQLVRHYMFTTEYLWKTIQPPYDEAKALPDPELDMGRTLTILDCEGVTISMLGGDVTTFMQKTIGFVGEHYPERSYKIYLINVSFFFKAIWNLVSPMVNEVTREKIKIMKKGQYEEELRKLVDPENLPRAYGGEDDTPLGESTEEKQMKKHVDEVAAFQGRTEGS